MKTTNLGFPNVYAFRIKRAVEGFWAGDNTKRDIRVALSEVLRFNTRAQSKLDLTPVFDIDLYDRMLKTAVLFGIVPKRFGRPEDALRDLAIYLSIPRGTAKAQASPMVKWFGTNYHVVQPEIERNPKLQKSVVLPDLKSQRTKLALIGPWTLLSFSLNKTRLTKQQLFKKLVAEYVVFINRLPQHTIVQLEEPSFITHGLPRGYRSFVKELKRAIHLHVYFGPVNDFAETLFDLPVAGIGLDFVDGQKNLSLLSRFPKDKTLIAGIINGRNVWPVTLETKSILAKITRHIPDERLYISPSCSLIHVPLTSKGESGNFSFAIEKLRELEQIKNGTIKYRKVRYKRDAFSRKRFRRARKSFWVSDRAYPTTTIGSYPQLPALRRMRKSWRENKISTRVYEAYVKNYIKECIKKQEELGLDVLVHGEPERADMVQYFAEHFKGFTPIKGAIQSYGTRVTRPPVITGPVSRPAPFTVKWISYAQSCTKKPVKGMLTGPVTIVQWSFPREDISRAAQMYEVAAALSDEVKDLVRAGITHIQIDEPALREGLPLDRSLWNHYLSHAVNAFRLVYASVPDRVVVHSHMCFSEFPDIMDAIREMGVDVLCIEDSKAKGKTAESVRRGGFPGSIGLGVYDVHSPRIPKVPEMLKIPTSLNINPKRIWVNPDCGLKTRGLEAYEQLAQMMKAVKILRARVRD